MNTRTTTESLKQLLALAAKATPGPWKASRERPLPGQQTRRINAPGFVVADVTIASFDHVLACSPDVIAELVNELLESRAAVERLERHYESHCPKCDNNKLDCACKP